MQTNKKNKKGFTLIEMLVVVGIIGILSTMLLVSVSRIRKNSIDTRRKANLENVRGGISIFYSMKSYWPCLTGDEASCTTLNWDNLISRLSTQKYLTDNIIADEDEDGNDDYSACKCVAGGCSPGCSPGSIMRLSSRCEVDDGEGCNNTTTCTLGWYCSEVK